MENQKPGAQVGEYKGSPVITIFTNDNENFKFTFGLGKAKAIINYLDEIKEFIKQNDKSEN